jgi:hypothetical protein
MPWYGIVWLIVMGLLLVFIVCAFVALARAQREYDRELKRLLDTYRRYYG